MMTNQNLSKIILTQDQQKANNAFLDFLVSDENFLVIQGAAGTGKSFLIKYLLETFYAKYKAYCLLLQKEVKEFDIKITATTNKAVNVIDDFLSDLMAMRSDIQLNTIYSLLGLKVTNDYKTGKTNLTFTNGGVTPLSVFDNVIPLVFVDEASFISEELHEIICSTLTNNPRTKIVYIGDKYQLAPVGQSFSAMDALNCTKVSLDEIVRNAGHILATGTQFRRTVETGKFQPIQFNNHDVIHVKGPTFQTMIESSFKHPHWDTSTSKVLAWTNERVQEYNNHIRQALNLPLGFEVGEVVVTNEFIKENGSYTRSVDSEVTITHINPQPTVVYGVLGRMIEIDDTYVSFMPDNFQDAKDLMKDLAAKAKDDKTLWKKFFEIKENWFDLRAVYSSSIHKSQGSTYETVFLDLADIGRNWSATDVARLIYVGVTRAAKQVVCYGYLPDRYCY
jgi:hypothetical protein